MSPLHLYVLGPFQALLADQPLRSFASDKERALLSFLALSPQGRPIRRELLVKMFWDGFTEATARHSLRNALYNLRSALAPLDLLHTTRQAVQLTVADPAFWCDALLVEHVAADRDASYQQVQGALALVHGELLQGLELRDCPAFTTWLAERRQRLCAQVKLLAQRREQLELATPTGFLPRALTPFFGREQELALLAGKLAGPACGLLTITGEGGIGKTRLALALAEQVRPAFPGGVWFIPLANLGASDSARATAGESAAIAQRLATAIASRLSISLHPGSETLDQLTQRLAGQHVLLLLDSFEHLHGAEPLLVDLLRATPNLHLMVTSRRRLGLQAECVFRLDGLPTPPITTGAGQPALSVEDLKGYAGVELFVERAERSCPGFVLDPSNQDAVAHICRLVEGLPLGIELAAALTEQHACDEIAAMVATNVDTLSSDMADLPQRQRSIRAVFEYSWQLLAQPERAALARCSVFRGGFDLNAAAAVADASPAALSNPLDRSLVRQTSTGRYTMHQLLRQLAAEKLLDEPNATELTNQRHCTYYAQIIHGLQNAPSDDPVAFEVVQAEIANLTAAWETAVRQVDLPALHQLAPALTQIRTAQGMTAQAGALYAKAVAALRAALQDTADAAEVQAVLGHLLYLHRELPSNSPNFCKG